MTMSIDEIRKLRRELERDLDALNRVEALLTKRAAPADGEAPTATKLTPLTIQVIAEAGPSGLRANRTVEELVKKGYKFTSKEAAASSVATTLKRLVKQGRLKKEGKVYTVKAGA